MKVYKFGGASLKDAAGIRNVADVLHQTGGSDIVIVASAMGKTTNALEEVLDAFLNKTGELSIKIAAVREYHESVARDLFGNLHHIFAQIEALFDNAERFMAAHWGADYDFCYDQIVSLGEMLSTRILSGFLADAGIENTWVDVRTLIKTDAHYRDASPNWEDTEANLKAFKPQTRTWVTQGFLGADAHGFTTTLGREGSDYTAAILAFGLNAESVTIWKDVPGVMNADPRYFKDAQLLNEISYREAIELAFYGATVIHPKTLQPLQRKEIPLFVKSFLEPHRPGTRVFKHAGLEPLVPCYIAKKNQLLVSLSSIDFSFIVEENISEIFALLHEFKMKVHLIQNSAISFSVCVDDKFGQFKTLRKRLSQQFKVVFNENVSLYTIRHVDEEAANRLMEGKEILLKQRSRDTLQLIVRENP